MEDEHRSSEGGEIQFHGPAQFAIPGFPLFHVLLAAHAQLYGKAPGGLSGQVVHCTARCFFEGERHSGLGIIPGQIREFVHLVVSTFFSPGFGVHMSLPHSSAIQP